MVKGGGKHQIAVVFDSEPLIDRWWWYICTTIISPQKMALNQVMPQCGSHSVPVIYNVEVLHMHTWLTEWYWRRSKERGLWTNWK